MALPTPNLDDRRFQDLVDDAKRMVQQRCPEWTDHNVSDPGVTLIESFAMMVDQLLYRLNRVPDRNYVKFLELIGVQLFPPVAAKTDVTFWLAAATGETVAVPVGTQVATTRTAQEESIAFTVVEHRDIVPSSLEALGSEIDDTGYRDHLDALQRRERFACFDTQPKAGDVMLIGLSAATPGCAMLLTIGSEIEGVGVDPRFPPLVWEAWTGDDWTPCDLERDSTGGLNRDGEVVLHVPRGHAVSVIAGLRAGWLRCRVTEPYEGQPFYSASPTIRGLEVATIGGTTQAVHAELVADEVLGLSEGVPGQRFAVRHPPVVPSNEPQVLEVAGGDRWEEWTSVDSFADSGPEDRHFVLDAVAGEVSLGPAVRQPDGSLRQYGRVPPKGAPLRLRGYRTGGGTQGNVTAGAITVLSTSMPEIGSVTNRRGATGGVDTEDIANARVRGPLVMRTRGRAVTAEDYEQLAAEAAPEVARIRCAPAGTADTDAGAVRVLIVPGADDVGGRLRFDQLLPDDETLERIASYLDARRMIGARVVVEPPVYQGITAVARVRSKPGVSPSRLQQTALEALYTYFHPIRGGASGKGWPFGRPIHVGEVYSTLQGVRGVEFVEDALLFAADPVSGERGEPTQQVALSEHALVFSFEHSVLVEEGLG